MSCRHEFVDVYDIDEKLSENVIQSASDYSSASAESQVLQAGKVKTKKHVMTYCKICGLSMGREIVVSSKPVNEKKPTKILEGLSTE